MNWWVVLDGVLVAWYFVTSYVMVWCVRGPLPPLEVGVSSLVLSSFGVGFLGLLSQKERKKERKRHKLFSPLTRSHITKEPSMFFTTIGIERDRDR